MDNRSKFLPLLLTLLLLIGCVPTKDIETLAIINAYGVDITEDNPQKIDVTSIVFQFNGQADNITQTLSGTGGTVREAFQNIGSKTSYNTSPGQIRLTIYGKETAENGILPYLNTLVRDSRVSEMMYPTISNTTAKELLTSNRENTGIDIAQHLQGIIEKEIEEDSIPDVSFYNFNRVHQNYGEDPLLPLLDIKENASELIGMALLRNAKYVGAISLDDAFLVNLFRKRIRDKPFNISLPKEPFSEYIEETQEEEEEEELKIDLLITDGISNTKLTDVDQPYFQTNIMLKANLFETSEDLEVKSKHISNLLEKEIEKEMESQYSDLLDSLQEANSDPFGLGKLYRIHKENGQLTSEEWHEKFPSAAVDFNVNVQLTNYGTIQ
ncbi:Ger(x)C family spore germination protein [Virgibacillus sp. NKC19-3]|uniref:Ger(x)C family spore germination protein n=1 Tax=Virgibacillus saliphilus TaxID=2831674 RepID=UPI001C9B3CC7|nr:Ger(x)C family spore germination protein [Virgibacillus sp. NKC19-3]MBY7143000.1 Ger(x)C family spore germination protein [Virgibacillus sp. NKC19-3]